MSYFIIEQNPSAIPIKCNGSQYCPAGSYTPDTCMLGLYQTSDDNTVRQHSRVSDNCMFFFSY